MRWHPYIHLTLKSAPPDPQSQDKQAYGYWKNAVLVLFFSVALTLTLYASSMRKPIDPRAVMFVCFPLFIFTQLPFLAERSVRPFAPSRPRYEGGAIVIPGNRESIARIISAYFLGIAAVAVLVYGFVTHYPLQAATYAAVALFVIYWDGTRRPISDLLIALRDRQTTTLTPEGISFHFPQPPSIEEHDHDTDVTILWKDNVHVFSIIHDDLNLFGNTTHPGPWSICSHHIGITYTGLDTLMRHFNDHPQDRPLLATPNGLDLVNQILTKAHKTITNPTKQ